MTRDEAKQKLIGYGVAEPTEDMISDYLATINKETKSAEDRANRYKADSDKVKALTQELDELKSANLSDVELAHKATEDALKQVAELQKTVKAMELSKSLAEIGIVGDDATQLVNEDGSLNTTKLGEILKNRETNAVDAYQKKILDETPSPYGGKPEEDNPVNDIAKGFADRNKAQNDALDIINSYK